MPPGALKLETQWFSRFPKELWTPVPLGTLKLETKNCIAKLEKNSYRETGKKNVSRNWKQKNRIAQYVFVNKIIADFPKEL